jgi:hypothetical protein
LERFSGAFPWKVDVLLEPMTSVVRGESAQDESKRTSQRNEYSREAHYRLSSIIQSEQDYIARRLIKPEPPKTREEAPHWIIKHELQTVCTKAINR